MSQNSRAISEAEFAADAHYQEAARLCERVGELCKSLAPIRIDARRISESGPFKLFDINMKPVRGFGGTRADRGGLLTLWDFFQNATGPGRPGREIQASLTLIAAEALGWSYPVLLRNMLYTATPVASLRRVDQETETQL